MIITIITTGIFYALKVANIKPPKASLDAIESWVVSLSKTMQSIKNGSKSDTAKNFIALSRVIKLYAFQLMCLTFQLLKYHQDW